MDTVYKLHLIFLRKTGRIHYSISTLITGIFPLIKIASYFCQTFLPLSGLSNLELQTI